MSEIELDGTRVYLYRSKEDGRLVIDVDTSDAEDHDSYPETGIPKLILYVNECREELMPTGVWQQLRS